MFAAWIITIGIFLICISATFMIMNGVKEQNQFELTTLQSQYKTMNIYDKVIKKKSA